MAKHADNSDLQYKRLSAKTYEIEQKAERFDVKVEVIESTFQEKFGKLENTSLKSIDEANAKLKDTKTVIQESIDKCYLTIKERLNVFE